MDKQLGKEVTRFIRYHQNYYGNLFINVNEIIKNKNLLNTKLTGKKFNEIFNGFILVRIYLHGRKRCHFLNRMAGYLDQEKDKKFTYITIPDNTTVFLSKEYGIILTKYEESKERLIKSMHVWKNLKFCRQALKQSGVAKWYATLHYTLWFLLVYCRESIF